MTSMRGFTLIEVLVAFAIATTALGFLFRVHSRATQNVLMMEEYSVAVALAQSLLDEHSVTEPDINVVRAGRFDDGYSWSVHATTYSDDAFLHPDVADAPQVVDADSHSFTLQEWKITVEWRSRSRDERFELHTVRPYGQVSPLADADSVASSQPSSFVVSGAR